MTGRGLLSRLDGRGSSSSSRDDSAESIIEHLRVLLNTRKGEAAAVPGFGVIDFTDLVHSFPGAAQTLQASIRNTILEYEPRLKSVTVRQVPDPDPLVLRFEISAQSTQRGSRGVLRFQTQVTPGGQFQVGGTGSSSDGY